MEWIDDPEACTGVRRYNPVAFVVGHDHYFQFVHEDNANNLAFLLALEAEGHWTHLGWYDNERARGIHFMTTKPDVELSGWNKFIYPLNQWIEWAKTQPK